MTDVFNNEPEHEDVYRVLLYYKFTLINDVETFANEHRDLCNRLDLRGRILVAPEGLNGTVSGTTAACEEYVAVLRSDPRFADMVFKTDVVEGHVFEKMFVRVKMELVTLRAGHSPVVAPVGTHLSPEEWQEMMKDPEVIVIDGRTGYEYDIGHFRGAIRPPVTSFREFPEWINQEFSDKKDAKILTYCTGGIRCEKLTSYMIERGFNNVYQLDGGIVSYGKNDVTQGAGWDGLCYVFDERIIVDINHTEDRRIVGRCHHCQTPIERYVNCANLDCHRQHLSCEPCERRMLRSCSEPCKAAPRRETLTFN